MAKEIKLTKTEKETFIEIYNTEIKNKRKIEFQIYGRRNLNILEAFGFTIEKNRTGDWNGYGYERLCNRYNYYNNDRIKWGKMISSFNKIKIKKERVEKSEEEIIETWSKRLNKLTGISIEESAEIAKEKIDYHEEKISEMIEKQNESRYPSQQREKLINKMERENPLRRIVDNEHANRILIAHNRHKNTNYEDKLEEAKELRRNGELGELTTQEHARGYN